MGLCVFAFSGGDAPDYGVEGGDNQENNIYVQLWSLEVNVQEFIGMVLVGVKMIDFLKPRTKSNYCTNVLWIK